MLEGELGGPDYGAQRTVETTAGGMLNGTGPGLQQSVQESGSQGVSVGGVLRSSLSGQLFKLKWKRRSEKVQPDWARRRTDLWGRFLKGT